MRALPLVALLLLLPACDDPERSGPAEAPAPDPAPDPGTSEPPPPPPPPNPPPPDPPEPRDLDDMSQGELEAACFDGDRRACDRLGH